MEMNPAPSYDTRLPHDLVHFTVESHLGISLGVFGQLAAGGTAGTFRLVLAPASSRQQSRAQKATNARGERLAQRGHLDAEFSERAATICHHAWLASSTVADDRRAASARAPYVAKVRSACSASELARLSDVAVDAICGVLSELSDLWRSLEVGQAIVLTWPHEKRGAA
jgi:hypothetical protein